MVVYFTADIPCAANPIFFVGVGIDLVAPNSVAAFTNAGITDYWSGNTEAAGGYTVKNSASTRDIVGDHQITGKTGVYVAKGFMGVTNAWAKSDSIYAGYKKISFEFWAGGPGGYGQSFIASDKTTAPAFWIYWIRNYPSYKVAVVFGSWINCRAYINFNIGGATHHYVFTIDFEDETSPVHIWIDGEAKEVLVYNPGNFPSSMPSFSNLYICNYPGAGLMDEVAVHYNEKGEVYTQYRYDMIRNWTYHASEGVPFYTVGESYVYTPVLPESVPLDMVLYIPDDDIVEKISYLTNVIKCRNGEYRYNCRTWPRHEMTCKYSYLDNSQFSYLKYYAKNSTHLEVLVPWWPYWNVLSVGSTDTKFYIDNADEKYSVGDDIVFIYGKTRITRIVLSSTDTYVETTESLGYTIAGVVVCPLVTAHIEGGVRFKRDGDVVSVTITFSTNALPYTSTQPYSLEGDGNPIIDEASKSSSAISEDIETSVSVFDGETGDISRIDGEKYNRHNPSISFMPKGHTDCRKIRNFLHWLKGKYETFWIETYNDETAAPDKILVRSDVDEFTLKHHDYDMFTVSIPCTEIDTYSEVS